jgi:LCP family protein required for cell wall assembly
VLSIPRDLWVEIPEFEHSRINAAYSLGELYSYPGDSRHPGGGPGLAMKTVENLLGVPIQYYAVIEFSAFERAIDAIGGINIQVDEDIRVNPIGAPGVDLWAGDRYHFDGAMALAYARSRRTEGGDFDRAQRQQAVLLAIRDTILNVSGAVTLLPRAPALYREVAAGLRTNLGLEQMVSLGLLAIQISPTNIHRGIIAPPDMVLLETLPDGAQVLKPIPDTIRTLRDEIFTLASAVGPSIPLDDPMAAAGLEAARVEVLNGAGIEGLATRAGEYLRSRGIDVINVANAEVMDYEKTVIIDHTGNPYTAHYLMTILDLTQSQILSQTIPDSPVDITVIIGVQNNIP